MGIKGYFKQLKDTLLFREGNEEQSMYAPTGPVEHEEEGPESDKSFDKQSQSKEQISRSNVDKIKRYPAMGTISSLLKVVAFIHLASGAIGLLIGFMFGLPKPIGFGICALSIIVGGGFALLFWFLSEIIQVFVDIEKSTRLTHELLRSNIKS